MAFDLSGRRQRWLLLLATGFAAGYGGYRLYHLPSVTRKRKKLLKIFRALISVADAVYSSSDAVNLVAGDLDRFLLSDSDEVPASLKQLAKIARSEEFAGSLSRVSEALTVGILRGFQSASGEGRKASSGEEGSSSGFSDRVLDRLFSASGSGFASVVVGSFARNLVIGFCSQRGSIDGELESSSPSAEPGWVRVISDGNCRELIAECIQRFVSTAVTVYLDKTMAINAYDEMFAGLTNPKHEPKVKEFLVSLCNGAIETLVKTSHQVMTASNSNSSTSSTWSGGRVGGIEQEEELGLRNDYYSAGNKVKDGGVEWVDRVSSTLALPSNRRLVLDVTGRVTFETVRSVLEFLLRRLCDGARKGVRVVRGEVVERGLEAVRYVSAKSMAIFTICLALCMHVSVGTRLLMPA